MKVVHIDFPAHYKSKAPSESLFAKHGLDVQLSRTTTAPPSLEEDGEAAANRDRIPPPREAWDFLPDLMAQKPGEDFKVRDDLKPLHVVQPEGVSFKMNGHVLEWQKWKMHIGERLAGAPMLCECRG